MTSVRYVLMRERHPTGIGTQCSEFFDRMRDTGVRFKTHRLRHFEVTVRGKPRLGHLSMLANRLIPLRKAKDELLHAGDMSLVPLFSDPFDIVEVWDTMSFERLDLYQGDPASAVNVASYVQGVLDARLVVTHSPSTQEDVRRFFNRESVIIPAGVDTDFFSIDPEVEKEPRTVLAVAAYYPQKNLGRLIRGCGEAGKVTLRLIGRRRGFEAEAIARSYPDLSLQVLGYVDRDRLREEYNRASVYCSASTREGFGVTPIEAMACGTLPVLSDIPPHRETVGGANGIFFDPVDVGDIGRAIDFGLEHGPDRDRLREAALRYSWSSVIDRWRVLYGSAGVCHRNGWDGGRT